METSGEALGGLLAELVELTDHATRDLAEGLVGRLGAGDFRVALVGEAKRGKSTLGNALVGSAVLPMGVRPVTAISTEVRAGAPERVEVSFLRSDEVYTTDVSGVERFVTERDNPHNHWKVARVCIYLPAAEPERRHERVQLERRHRALEDLCDRIRAAAQQPDCSPRVPSRKEIR